MCMLYLSSLILDTGNVSADTVHVHPHAEWFVGKQRMLVVGILRWALWGCSLRYDSLTRSGASIKGLAFTKIHN